MCTSIRAAIKLLLTFEPCLFMPQFCFGNPIAFGSSVWSPFHVEDTLNWCEGLIAACVIHRLNPYYSKDDSKVNRHNFQFKLKSSIQLRLNYSLELAHMKNQPVQMKPEWANGILILVLSEELNFEIPETKRLEKNVFDRSIDEEFFFKWWIYSWIRIWSTKLNATEMAR